MSHWSDRYVGLPYEAGVFDCGALTERVQREVFARDLRLPAREYVGKRGVEKFDAMSRQIEDTKDLVAHRVDVPSDGDVVLLLSRGRPQHVGVYCVINGEPWVLHAADSSGQVVRCRLRHLHIWSMAVEGYYKWK